jgi:putative transcriptional regulator
VGALTPDRTGDAVHNRIALLRAEQGVTRRELADALGVHYQTVGYLERGEYNPSLHLALRIAAFFRVPVEVAFSITPFPRISDVGAAGDPAPDDEDAPAPRP